MSAALVAVKLQVPTPRVLIVNGPPGKVASAQINGVETVTEVAPVEEPPVVETVKVLLLVGPKYASVETEGVALNAA